MTTPEDRLRSICWGGELLEAMQQDATLPMDWRDAAGKIGADYPSKSSLLELLATQTDGFPNPAGQTIEHARNLFESMLGAASCSADIRRHLLYTMRHFPAAGWSKHADRAARLGNLDEWLASDDPAPLA